MVRSTFLVLIIHVMAWSATAQVVSITKFYHNGKEMEIYGHGALYFSFHEFDTTLTDPTRDYLDVFGKYYRDSLLPGHMYIIDLTPRMSKAELEADPDLGFKRAQVVVDYLGVSYGIGKRNFRILVHETATKVCVGFTIKERRPRKIARRERRKFGRERIDEDSYFKEPESVL